MTPLIPAGRRRRTLLATQYAWVRLSGEAPSTPALVRVIDASPFFEQTAIEFTNKAPNQAGELFQIHSSRKGRK